jgi:hypothetical protein
MSNTFQILAQFLQRAEGEVEGRELQEPAEETKLQLKRLARGELPERDQTGLFAELNGHPDWIVWLAREIKAMRASS